jgi:hypothetical protein
VDHLTRRILSMFDELQQQTLDLHVLFEAGGNEPKAREAVFDTVERLVREGLLDEKGNDFYSLSPRGKEALRHGKQHP